MRLVSTCKVTYRKFRKLRNKPETSLKRIPHQFKLSIRWDKGNGMFGLKLGELHALMELAVINGNAGLAGALLLTSA